MASALRPSAACIAARQAPSWNKHQVVDASVFEAVLLAKASNARSLPHAASSRISAVHADAALTALAAPTAFPPLRGVTAHRRATLAGAWAARQQAAASCTIIAAAPGLSVEAEDVAPRLPTTAAASYLPPARRELEGATAAILAGCALAYPAPATPAQQPAAYVPLHSRTAKQQAAAAAEAGCPGRPCPFPYLTAGPLPQPTAEPPLPLYRLALLFPSHRCF